jgi:hypothetical protein
MATERELIGFRVNKELKSAAKAEAEADHRTISQVAELALIAYLEKKGRIKSSKD